MPKLAPLFDDDHDDATGGEKEKFTRSDGHSREKGKEILSTNELFVARGQAHENFCCRGEL